MTNGPYTNKHLEQYKLKRCSNKECCKQCRYVKFKGTMTKWPVQKLTHWTTQIRTTPWRNKHLEKLYFCVFRSYMANERRLKPYSILYFCIEELSLTTLHSKRNKNTLITKYIDILSQAIHHMPWHISSPLNNNSLSFSLPLTYCQWFRTCENEAQHFGV